MKIIKQIAYAVFSCVVMTCFWTAMLLYMGQGVIAFLFYH